MDLAVVLMLIYAVAFAAMFVLREPKWLGVGVLVAVALLATHFFIGRNAGGDAGIGVFVFGAVAAFGFASGAAARGTLIALRRRQLPRGALVAVFRLFFAGLPLAIHLWGAAQQRASQRRYAPPSLECKMRLHDARLGDRTVRLPLAWGIQVGDGPTPSKSISFYAQEKAREFCERTARGKPRLTMVRIDLPQMDIKRDSRQPICRVRRREAWWPLLCHHRPQPQIDLYNIALFDPARFDSETYLSMTVEPPGGDRMQYDSRWQRDRAFMRIGSGYEMYWRGPPRPGAASPYLARCYEDLNDPVRPDGLRCKAAYRLSPGVALLYDFRVDGSNFVPEALRQDERVSAIAQSLIVGDATVPSGG